ncbi:MAG: hypothetical protein O6705_09870, partial [Actinobacteria bacterium]|nr:hypothetical protein [Actinomycetota bacterium]
MTDSEAPQDATPVRPGPNTGRAALAGMLAGALALGVGELLAGISSSTPALVVSVGEVLVDVAPIKAVRAS